MYQDEVISGDEVADIPVRLQTITITIPFFFIICVSIHVAYYLNWGINQSL
jgi:hypothetical protein